MVLNDKIVKRGSRINNYTFNDSKIKMRDYAFLLIK